MCFICADFDPPIISPIYDETKYCSHGLSSENSSTPTVTDLIDINPTLSFVDKETQNCNILRTWLAKDAAGNIAESKQVVSVVSLSPIQVSNRSYGY